MSPSTFIVCEVCHKRLIERKSDGSLYFCFGKSSEEQRFIPVEILIYGSVRIKCMRKKCGHWNLINHFPEEVNGLEE